ncbi:MAG TPA: YIP1 family protein [Kiritimatiellia bacterium]|nr:YIP1 family protein [Kiritimatiellia bacterium]
METTTLNPWFSMWLHPRRTIRQIVATNPDRLVLLLAALGGIVQGFVNAESKSSGDKMSLATVLLISLIVGPLMGVFGLWLSGLLLRWTGGWIGGQADSRRIRSALAWSQVPSIWSLLLWIPAILLFGAELFTKATPIIDASSMLSGLYLVFSLGTTVIGIWSFVVFLHSLGEVQGFSAWRALLNGILAMLVVLIPILAIAGIAIWLA